MWISFFSFFIRYEGKNVLSAVSHQVILLLESVYCITTFSFPLLMNCEHLKSEMKSHQHMWRFGSPDGK